MTTPIRWESGSTYRFSPNSPLSPGDISSPLTAFESRMFNARFLRRRPFTPTKLPRINQAAMMIEFEKMISDPKIISQQRATLPPEFYTDVRSSKQTMKHRIRRVLKPSAITVTAQRVKVKSKPQQPSKIKTRTVPKTPSADITIRTPQAPKKGKKHVPNLGPAMRVPLRRWSL